MMRWVLIGSGCSNEEVERSHEELHSFKPVKFSGADCILGHTCLLEIAGYYHIRRVVQDQLHLTN